MKISILLLAALTASGILHAESVDIPVLYRNPAEVKTGQLQAFGFYENDTRIVLAFQIKDLQKVMEDPKSSLSFYADADNDLATGRYPKSRGWDFQMNVLLERKIVSTMIKWNGKGQNFAIRGQYTLAVTGDLLFVSIRKSAIPGIEFKEQFKFRTFPLRDNIRVDKRKTDGVFPEKFELPEDK